MWRAVYLDRRRRLTVLGREPGVEPGYPRRRGAHLESIRDRDARDPRDLSLGYDDGKVTAKRARDLAIDKEILERLHPPHAQRRDAIALAPAADGKRARQERRVECRRIERSKVAAAGIDLERALDLPAA